ncbi:hypothetical protein ABEB36_001023 [Hypothenemus hampei]|uniref:Proteasome assembly chaperone 2 n=1 Tax=Hypothenemus hampei TaxID=57062 RepID=A0ABD1FD73_HYPHA
MSLINFRKPVNLSGFTLIIPAISVGNVPQLTVDLLITTLKLENVASLWHPGVQPSVGADPFYSNEKTFCTACELYVNEARKLAVLQFRSTIEVKLALKFIEDLIDGITELKFENIYVLATGFDYELHNINNKKVYYYAINYEEKVEIEDAKPLEKTPQGKFKISGSGLAVKLYEAIEDRLKATLLVKYVSEGDNLYDAKCFFGKLLEFLNLKSEQLIFPTSWQYVYGTPPPTGLF